MSAERRLTHQNESGRPAMVNVADKPVTHRMAEAEGALVMAADTFHALAQGRTPKGDPLLVARIAGIQAAKRTAELIPLCHPLGVDAIHVDIEPDAELPGVRVHTKVEVTGKTGVEMEALTAASVALLTVYDMLKAIDRSMRIDGVRLLAKSGGRSGTWVADRTT